MQVSDFGLARFCSGAAADEAAAQPFGRASLAYKSPEQLRGKLTLASDVYAFGVLLCEMATDCLPYEGLPRGAALPCYPAGASKSIHHL